METRAVIRLCAGMGFAWGATLLLALLPDKSLPQTTSSTEPTWVWGRTLGEGPAAGQPLLKSARVLCFEKESGEEACLGEALFRPDPNIEPKSQH